MTDRPTPGPELDLDWVRAQFPALAEPSLESAGAPAWIHLENAGGSHLPRQVTELYQRYLTRWRVQPYGVDGPPKAAGEAMDRARQQVAATFNAGSERGADAGDVHIGPSTSQNTYVLAQAFRSLLEPGDEIVVTNQDHESNIGVWRRLADAGITIRQWSVEPERGLLDVADLEAILTERTRLVCVTHASNLAATVNPIARIAESAHRVGALVVVDGVSWAPHAAIDVADLDCDVYLYSAYKTYGPHQGLVWTRAGLAERLTNQGHWFNAAKTTARLTPAGPDHAAVAATGGMVDYYEDLHRHHFGPTDQTPNSATTLPERIAQVFELVAVHEERLLAPLLDFVSSRGLRLVGSASRSRNDRAPTVAFEPGSKPGHEVVEALAGAGIGIGYSDFYARRLVDAMGLGAGVVRISAVHYNTVAEIERTIDVLDQVL